jgi:hypothetical protein
MKVQVTLVNHRGIVQSILVDTGQDTFEQAAFWVTSKRGLYNGTTYYPLVDGTYKIDNIALVR